MNKFDFLTELRAKLWSIPQEDAERSVEYYSEMIDDRMEEGLCEEEAIAAVGDLDEIVKGILAETPSAAPAAAVPKKRRTWQVWEIVLLVLGFPVWGFLAIAAVVAAFSVWIGLWSVVISLYAAAVALGASAIGCVVSSVFVVVNTTTPVTFFVVLGAALVCAGLAILMFMLSNLAAKGMIALTKLCWQACKGLFQRKEQKV